MENVLNIKTREQFREWLARNSIFAIECFVEVKRGRPQEGVFSYLDAVEEAICFGWIDSVQKPINGKMYQRFSPRLKSSSWTELNKERARRLIKLGLIREEGRRILPDLDEEFVFDKEFVKALKKAKVWDTFLSFPELYQRIRCYNTVFYRDIDEETYKKALAHLIEETKNGNMYGEWNDYGRLLDY